MARRRWPTPPAWARAGAGLLAAVAGLWLLAAALSADEPPPDPELEDVIDALPGDQWRTEKRFDTCIETGSGYLPPIAVVVGQLTEGDAKASVEAMLHERAFEPTDGEFERELEDGTVTRVRVDRAAGNVTRVTIRRSPSTCPPGP